MSRDQLVASVSRGGCFFFLDILRYFSVRVQQDFGRVDDGGLDVIQWRRDIVHDFIEKISNRSYKYIYAAVRCKYLQRIRASRRYTTYMD